MSVFNGPASAIEDNRNKVSTIDGNSSNEQYPSAKAVYDTFNTFANALKGNASGTTITIDDVSPIEHNMKIQLRQELTRGDFIGTVAQIVDESITTHDWHNEDKLGSFTVYQNVVPVDNRTNIYINVHAFPGDSAGLLVTDGTTYRTFYVCDYNGGEFYCYIDGATIYISYDGRTVINFDIEENAKIIGVSCNGENFINHKLDLYGCSFRSGATLTKCGKNIMPTVDSGIYYSGSASNGKPYIPTSPTVLTSTQNIDLGSGDKRGFYAVIKLTEGKTYTLSLKNLVNNCATPALRYCVGFRTNESDLFGQSEINNAVISDINVTSFTFTVPSGSPYCLVGGYNYPNVAGDTISFEAMQIEVGSVATDFQDYISTTYTPNADGTVDGVTSLYPSTTLTTDTDGVIIDCEYNKDINIVLKYININTWKDIQDTVRAGFGHIRFPVGYEFTTEDATTGAVITWVVRDHDKHAAANGKLTHSMTLEAKYVYSDSAGTYLTLVFDAHEALYYAAEEIPAGTYNFTWNYATGSMVNGTYQFTLTKAVPAGGQIVLGTNSSSTAITGCKIATYATVAATAAIESGIVVTEGSEGTSLGTIAATSATSENLNCAQRIMWGSNNYAQSAARQWLNSDAAAGSVWTPTNKFDRAPSWATSKAGFMKGLPADFLAAVQPAAIPCRTNSVFEVNSLDGTEYTVNTVYTLNNMFFMLSRPEIYGSWDSSSIKDGELLEYYEGFTNTERIKYDAAGSARSCWLRSPDPGHASNERIVNTSGALSGSYAIYGIGVAPACIIA